MNTWTTKDGREIPVNQMSDSHIANVILMMRRKPMTLMQLDYCTPMYGYLSGDPPDGAAYAVESEIRMIDRGYMDEEILIHNFPEYGAVLKEGKRRGIVGTKGEDGHSVLKYDPPRKEKRSMELLCMIPIAGWWHHKGDRETDDHLPHHEEDLFLRPEPSNPYDPDAIEILRLDKKAMALEEAHEGSAPPTYYRLGYIPRDETWRVHEALGEGLKVAVQAVTLEGGPAKHVNIFTMTQEEFDEKQPS